MIRKITIHPTDGPEISHSYPYEIDVRDGVLRVHLENGNRTVAYPLTSVRSWDIER